MALTTSRVIQILILILLCLNILFLLLNNLDHELHPSNHAGHPVSERDHYSYSQSAAPALSSVPKPTSLASAGASIASTSGSTKGMRERPSRMKSPNQIDKKQLKPPHCPWNIVIFDTDCAASKLFIHMIYRHIYNERYIKLVHVLASGDAVVLVEPEAVRMTYTVLDMGAPQKTMLSLLAQGISVFPTSGSCLDYTTLENLAKLDDSNVLDALSPSSHDYAQALARIVYDAFTFTVLHEFLPESLINVYPRLCWELSDVLYLQSMVPKPPARKPGKSQKFFKHIDNVVFTQLNIKLHEQGARSIDAVDEYKQKLKAVNSDCEAQVGLVRCAAMKTSTEDLELAFKVAMSGILISFGLCPH
jgi:hypothetical protein